MKIIDGKKISNDVLDEIKIVVDERIKNRKKVPHLAAVLVGDDGPSETYVKSKIRACERVGFNSSLFKFNDNINEDDEKKEQTDNQLCSYLDNNKPNNFLDAFVGDESSDEDVDIAL